MQTLQKAVAQIRALEVEEIDLVGGGNTVGSESTNRLTTTLYAYNYDGHFITVTVTDDMYVDDQIYGD